MFSRLTVRAGLAAAVLLPASTSFATFHLMQIEQVIGGVNGDTTAQAIQLRMRSSTQRFVSESRVRVWDAAGANDILIVDMTTNVPNGLGGDRVLIASPAFIAATMPNAVPNFMMTNLIPESYLAAGSLTFEDDFGAVYWRLSWGGVGYSGSTFGESDNDSEPGSGLANFGPPFPGPLPSTTLQALRFPGASSALSTNNAADYSVTAGAAVFRNNARVDFTVTGAPAVVGDIDGDGDVDLDDHALCVACMGGPDEPLGHHQECSAKDFMACDLEVDGDVDLLDFAEFYLLVTP